MINTLSKINLSKIGWEGGRSTSIWIMSLNILFFFGDHPLSLYYVVFQCTYSFPTSIKSPTDTQPPNLAAPLTVRSSVWTTFGCRRGSQCSHTHTAKYYFHSDCSEIFYFTCRVELFGAFIALTVICPESPLYKLFS